MGGAASTPVPVRAKKLFKRAIEPSTSVLRKAMMKAYYNKRLPRSSRRRLDAEEEGKVNDANSAYRPEPEDESDTEDDELSKSWKHDNLAIDTTPEKTVLARVEYTPVGAEKDVYKYYCPLCMFYYQEVQESNCCKNYICYQCAVQYVAGKGGVDKNIKRLPTSLPPVSCPHCATDNLKLNAVCKSATVRLYHDTPKGDAEDDDTFENDPAGESVSMNFRSRRCESPLKIGDSFDDLKRKMLSFDDAAGKIEPSPALEAREPSNSSGSGTAPINENVLTEMPDVISPANGDDTSEKSSNSRPGSGEVLEESVPEFYEATAAEGEVGMAVLNGLEGFSTPRLGIDGTSHEDLRTPGEFGGDNDGTGGDSFVRPQPPMVVC